MIKINIIIALLSFKEKDQKVNCLPEQQVFITIKDHKTDFDTNPTYRIINLIKTEIGHISKHWLD